MCLLLHLKRTDTQTSTLSPVRFKTRQAVPQWYPDSMAGALHSRQLREHDQRQGHATGRRPHRRQRQDRRGAWAAKCCRMHAAVYSTILQVARGHHAVCCVTHVAAEGLQVNNTDAEGRLTLADALWYAQEHAKVYSVIDIATLTGAPLFAVQPALSVVITLHCSQSLFALHRATRENQNGHSASESCSVCRSHDGLARPGHRRGFHAQ